MDILILNWKDIKNPDVGGAEIILYELSKRLVKDGHTVTWFCRSFPGAKPEDTYDGIRIIRRGGRLSVYWQAFLYYRSLIKKPDRVLDCINTICWQTPLYVPKEKRIAYANQLAKEVFFFELPPVLSHLAYLLEPLEYRTYRDTKFLCYASSVKKDLGTFGIPEDNISVFPIGIDHNRYTPGKKSKDPLFIFVARLARMKRPDLCVNAMAILIRKYPKAKLALIGYGPMEEKLETMIRAKKLGSHVFLVNKDHLYFDKHPKDQKVRLMQEAWALLLPSVKEGWGMVITEAAACQTPAIGTRVTGLVDSIQDFGTGILLSMNPDAQELSDAMRLLIEKPRMREHLSNESMRMSARFTWDNAYTAWKSLV